MEKSSQSSCHFSTFIGFHSTYARAKAAVEHFCRAATKELGEMGLHSVNNVGSGLMDTHDSSWGMLIVISSFYPAESDDLITYHKNTRMNGRLTKIEEITPIVMFPATAGRRATG